ncbi:MAG: class I SAM-dependent methyltransferase [Rhodocyclaceae bacterium]|nr:MAG: class I SAM-dependent methyltransferase [Rhodocyclaceae bacterium]
MAEPKSPRKTPKVLAAIDKRTREAAKPPLPKAGGQTRKILVTKEVKVADKHCVRTDRLTPAKQTTSSDRPSLTSGTDLFDYFTRNSGRLIFKWVHYFDIYERHFAAFRGRKIKFLEIGVYHGGSLQMWKNYFGPKAKIIGVDINPQCKAFEEANITIEIGSQEDPDFLRKLAATHGPFDIVLDDGGHTMRQQIVSFQELYPQVRPNGLYVCEDLHTSYWNNWQGGYRHPNTFIEYAKGLIDELHAWHSKDPESFRPTPLTRSAFGMHFYDSMLIIEKRPIIPPSSRTTGTPSF